MEDKQTLFFLGAGASATFGFPCGNRLIEEICNDLERESPLKQYLRDEVRVPTDELERFGETFIEARNTTIDEFLELRDDLKNLARYIVGAKLISYEDPIPLRKTRNDWLTIFLRHLLKDCRTFHDARIALDTVTFCSLNYDRSVEYILFKLLSARYIKNGSTYPDAHTIETTSADKVKHIHGSLGKFSLKETSEALPFSNKILPPETFKSICENLKFWDDGCNEHYANEILNQVYLKPAKRVFILGFGFHSGILKRFEPNILCNKEIFCTTLGISNTQLRAIDTLLSSGKAIFGKDDQTCDDFMKEIVVD